MDSCKNLLVDLLTAFQLSALHYKNPTTCVSLMQSKYIDYIMKKYIVLDII